MQNDQIVLVAFDVLAATHEEAAALVCDRLAATNLLEPTRRTVETGPEIEAWFFPEKGDKWADRNDRDAIAWTWVQAGAPDPHRISWADDEEGERRPQQVTRDRLRLHRRGLLRKATRTV